MKKLFLGIIAVLILVSNAVGQRKMRVETMEKVQAYRVEYFTKNLELSPKESEAFWPIFDAYQIKKETIKKSGDRQRKVELMSDEEVETYLEGHLSEEQRMLDLKKDFFRQVKAVLPIRKVALIPQTEKNFRKEILSEMRRRRTEIRGPNRFGN